LKGRQLTDYFDAFLDERTRRQVSNLALAHIGDAVFELMVRSYLCAHGNLTAKSLHREAVKRVSAHAQAAALRRIEGILSGEERAVYLRGRNAHVPTMPKRSSMAEYHEATGLEALFGHLWLSGEKRRLCVLFDALIGEGG
jgi:ribonuclease-3 family protein